MLRAVKRARADVDAHLVITGSGPQTGALHALSRTLGLEADVTFTGYLEDEAYPRVHGLADCFINAGIAELQSIVALEALASGLPLLASNAAALPELVREGSNGYLFEPSDIEGLARRLVSVLREPARCREMGAVSRQIAAEHDIDRTTELYESHYRRIARVQAGAPPVERVA